MHILCRVPLLPLHLFRMTFLWPYTSVSIYHFSLKLLLTLFLETISSLEFTQRIRTYTKHLYQTGGRFNHLYVTYIYILTTWFLSNFYYTCTLYYQHYRSISSGHVLEDIYSSTHFYSYYCTLQHHFQSILPILLANTRLSVEDTELHLFTFFHLR